jgi:xanthine/uracil permease
MTTIVLAVDKRLAPARLAPLDLPHALVRPAGAIATAVIVGWALKRLPKQVVTGLNAALFAGGVGRSRDTTCAAINADVARAESV